MGIYIDESESWADGAYNWIVDGNTIINSFWAGIFTHFAENIEITNNTVYSGNNSGIYLMGNDDFPLVDLEVSGNIVFASTATDIPLIVRRQDYSDFLLGTLNSNYYLNSLSTDVVRVSDTVSSVTTSSNYDLESWQAVSSLDSSSQDLANPTEVITTSIQFNTTSATTTVELGETLYTIGRVATTSLDIGPYQSVVLMDVTEYTLASTSVNGSISVDPVRDYYIYGEEVVLTATPDSGYEFSSWSEDASGTDAITSLIIDRDPSVIATFSLIPVIEIPVPTILSSGSIPTKTQKIVSPETSNLESQLKKLSEQLDSIYKKLTLTRFHLNSYADEVKILQWLLARDKSIYPEAKITGYYGPLTIKAVQRFQKKYGIVLTGSPSTTGYGYVGEQTKAKIFKVFLSI